MILTTGVQLCLAHYCDVHGPTPLMVTEGLPIPCSACYEDIPYNNKTDRSKSTSSTPTSTLQPGASISEALRRLNLDSSNKRTSSSDPGQQHHSATRRTTAAAQLSAGGLTSSSAVDTPPVSPRHPFPETSTQNTAAAAAAATSTTGPLHVRRESSYRRTYDETTTKRAGPCENCAMTLPKRKETTKAADNDSETGPILRTKAPFARVFGSGTPGDASPPNSTSTISDDDYFDEDETSSVNRRPRRRGTITSTTSSTSSAAAANASSSSVQSHTHWLHYTSSHEPVVPSSFSVVRASCIRTLSFETLPRGSATNTASSSVTGSTPPSAASPSTPGFITTHSPGAAASGGPIFFGDPSAGYTTAYIFRIPDVHARGHKRVYAFLALSTHRERLAMKAFTFISNAFRELAAWIQNLAEAEAERYSEAANTPQSGGGIYTPTATANSSFAAGMPSQATEAGSGFLSSGGMGGGLSRRMGGGYGYGYGGPGVSLKARGLPELVGLPDFFLELHQKFVQLLLELGVVLSS
ncbi:vesicle coat protein [Coniella lustricola]|uniref:Vesicle coat protein n=1 Tax=Coniella lustricola TaxID=2025994 RepID=A0A2T2ZVC8_9PEZI|nr:vesicle coat protein [Coniella lustricola]